MPTKSDRATPPMYQPRSANPSADRPSTAYAKEVASQRLAEDMKAFQAQGGNIEVLGVTPVVLPTKRDKTPVAKDKVKKEGGDNS